MCRGGYCQRVSPTGVEGLAAAQTCHTYLKPGAALRIAVPDGLFPAPRYVDMVKADAIDPTSGKVPDAGGHSTNHKALYSHKTLKALFERAGFRVVLYEYSDEKTHSIARARKATLSPDPSVLILETRTAG